MLLLRFEFAKILCFVLFVLWIYFLSAVEGKQLSKRGIMDNINNGIKYAGQMFGINTAADVANLVAKAFVPRTSMPKQESSSFFALNEEPLERDPGSSGTKINPADMISGLLRMIGFDAGKLGALAINAVLMIAQLIGSALMRRQHSSPSITKSVEEGHNFDESQYSYESGDLGSEDHQDKRTGRAHFDDNTPLDWILTNPPEGLSNFIHHLTDQALPEKLVEMVGKIEQQNRQGDCIKLLLCKSAPFIWGMQKSISNRLLEEESTDYERKSKVQKSMSALFTNMPNLEEYRHHGELCERRFSNSCSKSGS